MALAPGIRLGPYEIGTQIGLGGMGEVYRATDTNLKRTVAIKVLPDAFAFDGDRLARFQREAEVLASLNHPNIAQVYGLEGIDGGKALVMELVEGPTLADRSARGTIPIDEALKIAKQIADALEAAHELGIVHRDLKPANIMVRPDGTVKVLDFGLAKALNVAPTVDLTQSPTMTNPAMSRVGVILGTAAYMAPEQARGKVVDKRADIWSFGCVLYEMITGRQVFTGEEISDTLASVLKTDPNWNGLPAMTPHALRRLLGWCLEKDPQRRLQSIGDARIQIEEILSGKLEDGGGSAISSPSPLWRLAIPWFVAFVFLVALGLLSFVHFRETPPPDVPEVRVDIVTPATTDPASIALSPDGRQLVFVASGAGPSRLWLRPLASTTAQPLLGTDGAYGPFWSPDSKSVGFIDNVTSQLKRIDIAGGAPRVLASANPRMGTWNREGIILFPSRLPSAPPGHLVLFRASATRGEPVQVTRLGDGETAHVFPQFLPDGRHFIYFAQGGPNQGLYVASLDGASSRRLATPTADAGAVVSPSGFLIFRRQATLFAQGFNLRRQELVGDPFTVAESVALASRYAPGFSASSDALAFRAVSPGQSQQLTWLDRSGKTDSSVSVGPGGGSVADVDLSRDGKRILISRLVNAANWGIWLIDNARGVATRLTFDADSLRPVWSPDGSRVVFQSNRTGTYHLYSKLSNGAGQDELLLESDRPKAPTDWSSDGRFLLFRTDTPQTKTDLWILPMFGERKAFPFLRTRFDERKGQFSPDGRWITYESDESGRFEIYAQPFPGPGGKIQISTGGGGQPRWNNNGKELFYVSSDGKLMAVQVKASSDGRELDCGVPVPLFSIRISGGPLGATVFGHHQYAVSPDGQRFLVNLDTDEGGASPITLIYNWRPKAAK